MQAAEEEISIGAATPITQDTEAAQLESLVQLPVEDQAAQLVEHKRLAVNLQVHFPILVLLPLALVALPQPLAAPYAAVAAAGMAAELAILPVAEAAMSIPLPQRPIIRADVC